MTENECINGWTFEETVKTAENLMEAESNMFKWDVLRHLRDFAENYKDELEVYREIGTIEEFKALKEKDEPKKVIGIESGLQSLHCPSCSDWSGFEIKKGMKFCPNCGKALET